jgi:hypothetical protein
MANKQTKQAVISHRITKTQRIKIERYCEITFGKSMIQKLADIQSDFVAKCWDHIREAEKIMNEDYLVITKKESNGEN